MTYFSDRELQCRCCGGIRLAAGFLMRLNELREAMGEPMIVNSACRCARHNSAINGHPKSLHVFDKPVHATGGTCAVDIRTPDERYREKLKTLALKLGFSVGLGKGFLHIDDRTEVLGFKQMVFSY